MISILIEIMRVLLESRIEREGKDRLDNIDQASKIIDECYQGI